MGEGLNNFLKIIQEGARASLDALQTVPENKHRYVSALNGVVGDTLLSQGSQLAIEMSLLGAAQGGKLCILVHGLCDSEDTWQFLDDSGETYGSKLQAELGYSPLYLRFNSGLHISSNGQNLSELLCELCDASATPIKEIIFIGHSMGGLIVRSACHYGEAEQASWVQHVKKIFLLGSPHLGTDYEKLGNLTTKILQTVPNLYTKGIAAIANKRSAGIKDLRFGYIVDEDWQDQDADALLRDNRHHVPLLSGVEYYILAAQLAKDADNIFTRYFGDGVVPTRSVTGQSFAEARSIPFSLEHYKAFKGLTHLGLARHRKVYKQILAWCR